MVDDIFGSATNNTNDQNKEEKNNEKKEKKLHHHHKKKDFESKDDDKKKKRKRYYRLKTKTINRKIEIIYEEDKESDDEQPLPKKLIRRSKSFFNGLNNINEFNDEIINFEEDEKDGKIKEKNKNSKEEDKKIINNKIDKSIKKRGRKKYEK